MSSCHVYVSNSPAVARHNVQRFAAAAGLSSVAGDAMVCALRELHARELIDIAPLGRGDIIVSPTVLASIEGAAAGVGWSRRIGVFNWPGSGSDASPDG